MDSLSQAALGAAIGVATMGRRTAVWKAALAGAVVGTLPDLDVIIDHGDAVRNMTFHRAQSHSLLYLTLLSPLLAWLIARLCRTGKEWQRWTLTIWLVLITHVLLDLMTVYGTQLLLPFTDYPFEVGSIFIVDPLYTLPLLIGITGAFVCRQWGLRANTIGLVLSTVYMGWTVAAQTYVTHQVRATMAHEQIDAQSFLVTPTAFNTLLWRVVVMTPGHYAEGFYSLVDDVPLTFRHYPKGSNLEEQLPAIWAMDRVRWFSHGFYRIRETDGQVVISDLRMGQEPHYSFNFVVARQEGGRWQEVTPEQLPMQLGWGAALQWIWDRLAGDVTDPPWLSDTGTRVQEEK